MGDARLLLGPLLRFVDETRATLWVETDRPCEVEVRTAGADARARTTSVDGCSYALVLLEGLEPATSQVYEVLLDGRVVWPEPGSHLPPSVVRTAGGPGPLRVVLGSCRASAPHTRRWRRRGGFHGVGRGVDALRAYAADLARTDEDATPGRPARGPTCCCTSVTRCTPTRTCRRRSRGASRSVATSVSRRAGR